MSPKKTNGGGGPVAFLQSEVIITKRPIKALGDLPPLNSSWGGTTEKVSAAVEVKAKSITATSAGRKGGTKRSQRARRASGEFSIECLHPAVMCGHYAPSGDYGKDKESRDAGGLNFEDQAE